MIIVLIISVLLNFVLAYLTWINFRKLEQAIEYAEQINKYNEACINFIGSLYFNLKDTQERMKEVDKLGAFAADDQVGFAFKEIQEAIDDVYGYITKYVNKEEEQKK